ncbi:MAG TPA: glycosyltransferase family 4 protein [Gemmatimonadales bacterium]|nr:glycosyltransferase family 4 protein [Gemmatimonadales bacterium]
MRPRLRVLFFVEGFTDIRFVVGLSEVFDLSLAVAARPFAESGLGDRIAEAGLHVPVHGIPGGRLAFQLASLRHLLALARDFDVILAQENLRGALSANLAGRLRGVPVVTFTALPPLEYFRCRRERGQIGAARALAGELVIRFLLRANGLMAARCVALGEYLRGVASHWCPRCDVGLYYGVDTDLFRPADAAERIALRRRLDLPADRFVVVLSSRISHEKDPETVLRAAAIARSRGLDAWILNLGGGHEAFLALARSMAPDADAWVAARPAVHPMHGLADYYRAADALAQASLAEGLGLAPLEALACGVPVAATAVGGMALTLEGRGRLSPRRDPEAMAEQLLWIAAHRDEARAQALAGRDYVVHEWNRGKAFADLRSVLERVAGRPAAAPRPAPGPRVGAS